MKVTDFDKKAFKKQVITNVRNLYRKELDEANAQEVYQAVALCVKDDVIENWIKTQKTMKKDDPKIVYYMSMEFLIGRLMGNNMISLGEYAPIRDALSELGFDLTKIEDQEPDPALGNGGLGRLAACFLESLSTLGYVAYGCGIRYRYGMFKQKIEDGFQKEVPDNWLEHGYPFEIKRPEYKCEVKFGGYVRSEMKSDGNYEFIHEGYRSVMAVPYDMPVVGYGNNVVNTLRIWDAEAGEVFSLDSFDKG
ncbi:MAG: glycogen/starch/alpha-glucan phosphorylase, partial [Lachnospiraceae bacterium]|nr:glycogen/starch/alpha-glucan phosphorylase [Lachnospiraceae bacterium]